MKILLISPLTKESKGGIAIWTEYYINGCKHINSTCEIVNTALIGSRLIKGISKRNLKDEFVRTKNILKELSIKLKNNSFDIAHLNTSVGTFGIIRDFLVAKRISKHNIPIVLHFHCDIPVMVNNKLTRHFLKKILKLSNKNFVLCTNSQKYLLDSFGATSIKIPNFINEQSISQKCNTNEHIKTCVFVGRVSKLKGAYELFDLSKQFPTITFNLIGEVSPDIAELKKPSNINLLGKMSNKDVFSQLKESDVFIFPSHTEGFSVALMESMACGLPSIVYDVGANADMLEGKGGIVLPFDDSANWCEALKKLDNQSMRIEMSNWAFLKVKNNYTTENVMKLIYSHYTSI